MNAVLCSKGQPVSEPGSCQTSRSMLLVSDEDGGEGDASSDGYRGAAFSRVLE